MRRVKLCVVLLVLGLGWYGLPGRGFAQDYTQSTNFGVLNPGDHVHFTVTPPKNSEGKDAIVTSGRVDNPGGFTWVGSLANWNGTVPPDFSAQHIGLFSGEYGYPGTNGGRALTWQANTEAEVVKLETITWATIPSDRTRRKLGVGEKVTLTLAGASGSQVAWSKSGPGNISYYSGISTEFTAYERGINASVTATYKGKTYTANFTVVEPFSESAVKRGEETYPAGMQGAGMWLDITEHSTDVSFDKVEIRELPGPATGVYGYWTNSPTISDSILLFELLYAK